MFRKAYTLFVVVLIPFLNLAQGSRDRSAAKDIARQRWGKAFAKLQKSIAREPSNVPAYYLLSTYYFTPANPQYHVDSAYRYIQKAIGIWNVADPRSRDHWTRSSLDSMSLITLREGIDSAAFDIARQKNSEQSYSNFIEQHPHARQQQTAIELRYVVAFDKAFQQNTPESFSNFINEYPSAPQVPEARSKYDDLLFLHSTQDNRLESFEAFLEKNPDSPYRPLAEKNIYEIMTAKGRPDDFVNYLKKYPNARPADKAKAFLFHLLKERNASLPQDLMTDSLSSMMAVESDYLVPIFVKEKFGLMNSSGNVIVPPTLEEIADEYLCGNITEDVIVLPGKMITKKGDTILSGSITDLEDLGYGFMKIKINNANQLIQKGGYPVGDVAPKEVRVLNGRMLALKADDHWGVFTLSGRRITPSDYSDIYNIDGVVVFEKEKKYILSTIDTLAASIGAPPFLTEEFDEVKKLGANIWVRKYNLHGAYNQGLVPVIPLGDSKVIPAFFGATLQSAEINVTYNQFGEVSENFIKLNVAEPWVAAKTMEGWILYSPEQRMVKSVPYDTLSLYGPFAVGKKKDGYEINFFRKPEKLLTIAKADQFTFLPGKDSVSYLIVKEGAKMIVYDTRGQNLFSVNYDMIETAGNDYFIVTKKEKHGLINSSGKLVVPIQYDAIGSVADGIISLLKGTKFGAYDIVSKVLIPAVYEKNITRFGKNTLLAFKGGAYGFITSKNKPLSDFSFSEILPWKDSVALVRQGTSFQFYNFYKKNSQLSGISTYRSVNETPSEKLVIINREGNFGVISNKKGIIIPLNFSDIVNVGSPEHPMYFTEKHVAEASLFVVIYYDSAGKLIRREVYEQSEYDRIYCDKK